VRNFLLKLPERRELTVVGKGNKLRTIDREPMNGYAIINAAPECEGKDWLFWRTEDKRVRADSKRAPTVRGDQIEDPGPTFARIKDATIEHAEEGVPAVPVSRSQAPARRGLAASRPVDRSMTSNSGSGTPPSRPPRNTSSM